VPWLSITLELDAPQAEAFSEALMEAGAESVTLDPEGALMRVSVLAAENADGGALVAQAAGAAGMPVPAFSTARLADEDWVRRSQSQFGPIRISQALWIVPSWHEPPDAAATAVRLDPGLAFGTGGHVSTRLVLNYLEQSLRSGQCVLDYGCGSGILAIVAAKLGAAEVDAVDIDPQALAATAANANINGVRVRCAAPDALPAGNYDLVLANILAGPLIALQPLLAARARRGGRIALSGILETQAADVARAYAQDFDIAVAAADEGWALLEGSRR
jgi:ribosomal protein L11 methyltransferase